MSLNVRFTTNGVCSKTCNHIHVARTNKDLSPFICNVCEFSGTNYCMPTRWLTGPLQKIPPPWLKPLVTPLTVGGRHFPMSGPWMQAGSCDNTRFELTSPVVSIAQGSFNAFKELHQLESDSVVRYTYKLCLKALTLPHLRGRMLIWLCVFLTISSLKRWSILVANSQTQHVAYLHCHAPTFTLK